MQCNSWTPLEIGVLRLLLAGDDPVLGILREQFNHAELLSHEFTGVGFYTHFAARGFYSESPMGDSTFWKAIRMTSLGRITGFTVRYMGCERDLEQVEHAWER